jgi:hypothetical protein
VRLPDNRSRDSRCGFALYIAALSGPSTVCFLECCCSADVSLAGCANHSAGLCSSCRACVMVENCTLVAQAHCTWLWWPLISLPSPTVVTVALTANVSGAICSFCNFRCSYELGCTVPAERPSQVLMQSTIGVHRVHVFAALQPSCLHHVQSGCAGVLVCD